MTLSSYALILQRFDRKERSWLVQHGTGGGTLTADFCQRLNGAFGD